MCGGFVFDNTITCKQLISNHYPFISTHTKPFIFMNLPHFNNISYLALLMFAVSTPGMADSQNISPTLQTADVARTSNLYDVLKQEVETKALKLPETLPAQLKEFLPIGAKGTSREECLVLQCDTIIKENNVMPAIMEFLMDSLDTTYAFHGEERRYLDGHVYWLAFISPVNLETINSAPAVSKKDESEIVTIWMDVTSSNQEYTIEERDAALRRASALDDQIIEIFASISDHATAEQAVVKLRPLVDAFEKEMHIVILGSPKGDDNWRLNSSIPNREAIMDKIASNRFWESPDLFALCMQIASCYISNVAADEEE